MRFSDRIVYHNIGMQDQLPVWQRAVSSNVLTSSTLSALCVRVVYAAGDCYHGLLVLGLQGRQSAHARCEASTSLSSSSNNRR
jgi:hypothetical protein